jgi:competence ComEA-like helix-hairpin-helix protein
MLIFDFNNSEKRGLLFLAIIVVLGLGFRIFSPMFIDDSQTDFSQFKGEVKEFELAQKKLEQEEKELEQIKQNKYKTNNYKKNNYYKKDKYKSFDNKRDYTKLNPNKASISDWQNLGFSKKQSSVIYNYIKQIGFIEDKTQLKKIFVISTKKYSEIEPYIVIDKSDFINKNNKYSDISNDAIKFEVNVIDVNLATKDELMAIKGIGEWFSDKIIEYRDYLGGFYSKEQLKEVYGINDEVYDNVKNQITINSDSNKKINVNFCDEKDLSSHPYISYKDAKAIVNYRTKNGFIKDIDILFDENILTNIKLKHYLITQE